MSIPISHQSKTSTKNFIITSLNSLDCIKNTAAIERYVDFCLDHDKGEKVKGQTSSHHILPCAKKLPFEGYSNLKDNAWNKSELTFYDHYRAHYHYELRGILDGALEQPLDQMLAELGYDEETAPSGIHEASRLDSLIICNQCQYLGDIPPAAITVAKKSHNLSERVETIPYQDYTGNDLDLVLVWNPTPQQSINLIGKSREKQLRVLLVGSDMVVWDAYYVEHADVEKLLGLDKGPRKIKMFVGLREDDTPYISNKSLDHPRVQTFIKAGFGFGIGDE